MLRRNNAKPFGFYSNDLRKRLPTNSTSILQIKKKQSILNDLKLQLTCQIVKLLKLKKREKLLQKFKVRINEKLYDHLLNVQGIKKTFRKEFDAYEFLKNNDIVTGRFMEDGTLIIIKKSSLKIRVGRNKGVKFVDENKSKRTTPDSFFVFIKFIKDEIGA